MTNLSLTDLYAQFKDEVIVHPNGMCEVTATGLGRLIGVSQQAISRHFGGTTKSPSKLAKLLAEYGIEAYNLDVKKTDF